MAGFIAADGCIISNKRNVINKTLSIHIAKEDETILSQFLSYIHSNHRIYKTKTGHIKLNITSRTMCEDLRQEFNIVPRKTFIYALPPEKIDHPLIHHFLRGYIDGDGTFSFNNRGVISQGKAPQLQFGLIGTKLLLEQVRHILYTNCATNQEQTIRQVDSMFVLQYGGNGQVKTIVDYLYQDATFYLDRKFKIAQQARPYPKGYKLTLEQVRLIRYLLSTGTMIKDIATQFGVGRGTISEIKHGKAWGKFQ